MVNLQRDYFSYSSYNSNIHLVRIHNIEPVNEAFDEYVQFSDHSTKSMKGAIIIDISRGKFLSLEQRVKLNKVINSNNEHIAKNWTSIAYVNTSVVARIILKGKLWMSPLPVKAKVFTSVDDAVTWSYKIFLSNN